MSDDLLTQLANANEAEREWLLLKAVLDNLEAPLRRTVWVAAVPHWFDALFLQAMLDPPEESEFSDVGGLDRLAGLSFVEPLPGRGYYLQDRSRALFLDRLWQEQRDRYQELCRRAAEYCAEQDQADDEWRIEWIYHLLIANPPEGANQLQKNGMRWQNPPLSAYEKVSAIARTAREHLDAGRLDLRSQCWTLFWEVYIDLIYARYEDARKKLGYFSGNTGKFAALTDNGIKAQQIGSHLPHEINRRQLRLNLNENFSETELRTIAFDLGVKYYDLEGGSKQDRVLSLIEYFDRRERLFELWEAACKLRPKLTW